VKPTRRERIATAGLVAFALLAYGFWLTNRRLDLWSRGAGLGLTFNSMLEHLLRGEFDVDPAVVGAEGFRRDGRVYAYWGIFGAVLRLPLLLVPGGLELDVTGLSCLVAVSIAAVVKLRTLHLVAGTGLPSATLGTVHWTLALAILFSGAQIQFLRPSIYQEVCLWAGALAALFVCCAVADLVRGGFATGPLCAMATLAGLTLLTRLSTGVGLYTALGLLLVALLVRPATGRGTGGPGPGGTPMPAVRRGGSRVLLPGAILAAFALLAAFVNYRRWGHPLTGADYRLYIMNADYPDRLPRTETYGLFNLARVPFGLVYYLLPVWVLRRADGRLLFEEHQRRLLDMTELPPSSFFLTDPLLVLLLLHAGWSLLHTRRGVGIARLHVVALSAGLAVGPTLMLSAISMTFRYRIEFYPLLEFGAFLGYLLLRRRSPPAWRAGAIRAVAITAAAAGIVLSHAVMVLYKVSLFGPPIDALRGGVLAHYVAAIRSPLPGLGALLGL
jgi:hypothetical protein